MSRNSSSISWRASASFALCFAAAACSDSMKPGTGGNDVDAEKLRAGVLVSGPLNGTASASRAAARLHLASASSASADSDIVYVSMPPGTLAGGDSAQLSAAGSVGAVASTLLGDGGFDPVPLHAIAGDSLDVTVYSHGSKVTARVRIPAERQPSVVRTTPGRGRTDVPLNQGVVIVFTQPIAEASVTPSSVQLSIGGTPVAASLAVQAGQPWVVRLTPAVPLAANTSYDIVVTTAVTDVNGLALTAGVSANFVTGSTTEDIASISVRAQTVHVVPPSSAALAVPGAHAVFTAEKISANGDTLASGSGASFVWSSSNALVATVRNSGDYVDTVTAVAQGQATISACVGEVCGSGTILVNETKPGIAPTDLGDLGGGESRVDDMAGGYVVGSSTLASSPSGGSSVSHAFIWSAARGMEDLGVLAGQVTTLPAAVNSSGTVVGYGYDAQGTLTSWIWKRSSGIQPLTLPDQNNPAWFPVAVNASGEVGFSDAASIPVTQSMLGVWSASRGGRTATLPLGMYSSGGMNDALQFVLATTGATNCDGDGNCVPQCGTSAFVWDFELARTTSTLEPRDSTGAPLAICPSAINNDGSITGVVQKSGIVPKSDLTDGRAFRWTRAGGFSYFPSAAGQGSLGEKLNQAGDATVYLFSYNHVGQDSVYEIRSAVWLASGNVRNLGSLGGTRTAANGINDSHLVAGHSQVGSTSGRQHAVIWNLDAFDAAVVRGSRSPISTSKLHATP